MVFIDYPIATTKHWKVYRTTGTVEEDLTPVVTVLDKLAALGTADAIALHFQTTEITGMRGSATQCPVAQWLDGEVDMPGIRLVVKGASVLVVGEVHNRALGLVNMPEPVQEFVRKFDGGRYPKLHKTAQCPL